MIAAGLIWDLHSETPSRYLTARVKAREAQRLVSKVRYPTSQELVTSTSDILDAFYTYYTARYDQKTDKLILHANLLKNWQVDISTEELASLATPITEAEVTDAILCTDPNKAPGPDGLTGWFYRIHARL
jgi:hypothetical protein